MAAANEVLLDVTVVGVAGVACAASAGAGCVILVGLAADSVADKHLGKSPSRFFAEQAGVSEGAYEAASKGRDLAVGMAGIGGAARQGAKIMTLVGQSKVNSTNLTTIRQSAASMMSEVSSAYVAVKHADLP